MLGKKEKSAPTGGQTLHTIIGRGTSFEGTMKVDNSVRIDGIFKGELTCSGALTISQTGEACARLEGKEVYINGTVRGTVRAEKVRLDSQARFVGDIYAGALSISEGALFQGNCSMETDGEKQEARSRPADDGSAQRQEPAGRPSKAAGGQRQTPGRGKLSGREN